MSEKQPADEEFLNQAGIKMPEYSREVKGLSDEQEEALLNKGYGLLKTLYDNIPNLEAQKGFLEGLKKTMGQLEGLPNNTGVPTLEYRYTSKFYSDHVPEEEANDEGGKE